MPTKSKYIIQKTQKSHCPECNQTVDLLAPINPRMRGAIFYICWNCKAIFQAGVGEVIRVV